MSTYCYYTVEIQGIDEDKKSDIIKEIKATCSDAEYLIDDDGWSVTDGNWVQMNRDMVEFSKKYPDLLFTVVVEYAYEEDIGRSYVYFKEGLTIELCPAAVKPEFIGFDTDLYKASNIRQMLIQKHLGEKRELTSLESILLDKLSAIMSLY